MNAKPVWREGHGWIKLKRDAASIRWQRRFSLDEFETRDAMDVLSGAISALWYAIEHILNYVETHHWIFAFLAGGYIFYLHDKAVHARFDALEKRIDEIRKRLALEF